MEFVNKTSALYDATMALVFRRLRRVRRERRKKEEGRLRRLLAEDTLFGKGFELWKCGMLAPGVAAGKRSEGRCVAVRR